MGDTKEAILTTALQLFAGNGYEAVSVSEIAGALIIISLFLRLMGGIEIKAKVLG